MHEKGGIAALGEQFLSYRVKRQTHHETRRERGEGGSTIDTSSCEVGGSLTWLLNAIISFVEPEPVEGGMWDGGGEVVFGNLCLRSCYKRLVCFVKLCRRMVSGVV